VPRLTRGGISLAYDDTGTGDPPFLFIHGMACNRSHFAPQVAHFGRTHRVVAFDERGHGESDKPLDAAYDEATLADDAYWLAGELGLEHPVVVGHSLGGSVATSLASRYPDFPSAVVILDSGFEMPPDVAKELAKFYAALSEDVYDSVVRAFVAERLFDEGDDPALVGPTQDVMAACPREIFLAMGRAVLAFDQAAAADKITAPTLFIASSRPWIDLSTIRRRRPDWYLGRTVGAGHFHQLLVPDQVNAMIERFVAQVGAGFVRAQDAEF
jgi:pimeloyl-ACP methyl ester carboxylesterase